MGPRPSSNCDGVGLPTSEHKHSMKTSQVWALAAIVTSVLAIPTQAQNNPEYGLMAYYQLDGNSRDVSGLTRDATPIGSPAYATGVFGRAVVLNGRDQFLDCPALGVPDSITVAGWVNISKDPGNSMEFFGTFENNKGAFNCSYVYSGPGAYRLLSEVYAGGWQQCFASSYLVPGRWYHFASSYDSQARLLRIFLDGQIVSTQSNVAPPSGDHPVAGTETHIGRAYYNPDPDGYFVDGLMDEVRIYNRALAPSEIASLAARPFMTQGLVAYFPFNGSPADVSGNGNPSRIVGTLLGAPDVDGSPLGAYALSPTGGYVEAGANGDLSFDAATESYSVAAWFQLDTLSIPGGYAQIIKDRPVGRNTWQSYGLSIALSTGTLSSVIWNGSTYEAKTLIQLATNRWYHVVSTVTSNNTHRLYLDGVLVDSENIQGLGHTKQNSEGITIGAGYYPDGLQHFSGSIDDVRIYNRALSEDEVRDLHMFESVGQPRLSISVKSVTVTMSLRPTVRYQLQASADLITWADQGDPFVATGSLLSRDFDVAQAGRYFRLQMVP